MKKALNVSSAYKSMTLRALLSIVLFAIVYLLFVGLGVVLGSFRYQKVRTTKSNAKPRSGEGCCNIQIDNGRALIGRTRKVIVVGHFFVLCTNRHVKT